MKLGFIESFWIIYMVLDHRPVNDLIIWVIQHGEGRIVLELDVWDVEQNQSEQSTTTIPYFYVETVFYHWP